jgi:hypothetical protein
MPNKYQHSYLIPITTTLTTATDLIEEEEDKTKLEMRTNMMYNLKMVSSVMLSMGLVNMQGKNIVSFLFLL